MTIDPFLKVNQGFKYIIVMKIQSILSLLGLEVEEEIGWVMTRVILSPLIKLKNLIIYTTPCWIMLKNLTKQTL